MQDCRVTLTSTVQGQSVQQVPLSSPAKTKLIELCFVNPSSRAAVLELMRHVGQLAGVTQYGGAKREWLGLTCDEVPYMLMRKVIQEAKLNAAKEKLCLLGWVDTSKMFVKDLKAVLKAKKLPLLGSKADLISRIEREINAPLLC